MNGLRPSTVNSQASIAETGSKFAQRRVTCRRLKRVCRTRSSDLSLAEWGRKEIMLAENEMPGLMALREKYGQSQAADGRALPAACT